MNKMSALKIKNNYRENDGCHNCKYPDRSRVASGIYPFCPMLMGLVDNYCICDKWLKRDFNAFFMIESKE